MRKARIILLLALIVVAISGCVRQEDVIFHGIENIDFSYKGNIRIDVLANIENRSGSNIVLKEANFKIVDGLNNTLANLVIPENITVPKHSNGEVSIPIYAKISNIFAAIAIAGEIAQNPNEVYIEGKAIVKAGLTRKKIRIEKQSLRVFVEEFGGGDIEGCIENFMDSL